LNYSDYESEYLKLSEKDFGKKQLNDARSTMRFLLKFLALPAIGWQQA
jgi:hypothetical protein